MTQDNEALQNLFNTVHYNERYIDAKEDIGETEVPEEDEDEVTLSPEQQLAEMSDDEFDTFLEAHFIAKRNR